MDYDDGQEQRDARDDDPFDVGLVPPVRREAARRYGRIAREDDGDITHDEDAVVQEVQVDGLGWTGWCGTPTPHRCAGGT